MAERHLERLTEMKGTTLVLSFRTKTPRRYTLATQPRHHAIPCNFLIVTICIPES
jgi:hypothetical protein